MVDALAMHCKSPRAANMVVQVCGQLCMCAGRERAQRIVVQARKRVTVAVADLLTHTHVLLTV